MPSSEFFTLPGLIDTHVHFRTGPKHLRTLDQTYKEDPITRTWAAVRGEFTTVLDMPNNLRPVTSAKALAKKLVLFMIMHFSVM